MAAFADPSVLAKAFDWIKARLARDNEMATLGAAGMSDLAADIGVTPADLCYIVPTVGDHSELMDEMMRARGLEPAAVRKMLGVALIHDMEVTCARCHDARLCRAELEAGTAAEHCHEFCGNAGLISEVLTSRR